MVTSKAPVFEAARVRSVFLDVVGFTRKTVDAQAAVVKALNEIVLSSLEKHSVPSGPRSRRLLPTGDGMCICLIKDDGRDTHVRIALTILEAVYKYNRRKHLKEERKFGVRVGVNVNKDILIKDVNGRPNVAGDGVNLAQRIMNAGDSGHLLLSAEVCSELRNRDQYKSKLVKGSVDIKHEGWIHVYQYRDEAQKGLNCSPPKNFFPSPTDTAQAGGKSELALSANLARHEWLYDVSDWRALINVETPQNTAFREVPLRDNYLYGFECSVRVACDYVRFGVKLMKEGTEMFGKRSINSPDENILIHVGKEKGSGILAATWYSGMQHRNRVRHVADISEVKDFSFRLEMVDETNLQFSVNGNPVFQVPCSREVRKRLVMMAWGDGHPFYDMTISRIRLALSPI